MSARKKPRETFSRYDAADYLKTDADIAAYLDAVIEDGDPALLAAALGDIARARNMSQLARDTGLSREGLYRALSGDGNPSLDTVMKIARALGLRLAFQPAGSKKIRAHRRTPSSSRSVRD
ncbi:MAG: putative addiction module antidote protein [Gammaproteobacteria bacterium]|nr:MAG: putative addiction module antidote protein [Gammaproteobacteria bacterium]